MSDLLNLFDKRGIPFRRGDIVKVFHFIGARRKRHYMYKQVLGLKVWGEPKKFAYVSFSHLNFIDDHDNREGPYTVQMNGHVLTDYEIVQSLDALHEERPRKGTGQ